MYQGGWQNNFSLTSGEAYRTPAEPHRNEHALQSDRLREAQEARAARGERGGLRGLLRRLRRR